MSRNGLRNKNHIKIGQVLYLRAPEPEQAVAVPAPLAIAPSSPAATAQAALGTEAVPQVAVITQAQAQYAATASLADPLDYTVAADATIEIQAAETLGLYADWLGLQAQRLRDLNGMSPAAELIVGERIRLEFQYVDKTRFESQRIAHHRKIQEDFFIRYRVTATTEHTLQAGESIWQIAQAKYNVPVWLLRQYNPDLDFGRVKPGMSIIIPQLQPITRGAANRNLRLSAS
jgi:membrane-bound lytic murein transglycosylase D